jgi:hypothetical protein
MTEQRTTQTVEALALPALVLAALLQLAAAGFVQVALTGDGWDFLGYYYAGVIAAFEVLAAVLAVVALRRSKVAPGKGRVAAATSALSRSARCCSGDSGGLCS